VRVGSDAATDRAVSSAAVAYAIAEGWRLRLVGPPGIGKTSHIRAAVEAAGYELEYLSLSQASVHDLVVPVPVAGKLDFLPAARLVRPDREYVLVLDEFSRAPAETASAAMELVNEKAIAGRPLEGCVAVIALDNPAEVGGLQLDTGRIDAAQASRFTATIEVGEDDLPWREVLLDAVPGETAPRSSTGAPRTSTTPPGCWSRPAAWSGCCRCTPAGSTPSSGCPSSAASGCPSRSPRCAAGCGASGPSGSPAVLADLDDHLARLEDGDPHTELTVLTALQRADVASLRAATSAVARLLARCTPTTGSRWCAPAANAGRCSCRPSPRSDRPRRWRR
jgi:hypothetical protein